MLTIRVQITIIKKFFLNVIIHFEAHSVTERDINEFKKINCTILNEKFQFCIVDFKIVDFVCDFND